MKLESIKSEQRKERTIIKKFVKLLKDTIYKILFHIKLKWMDDCWYHIGASSWQLFPPSFYYTHTEEEVERIIKETIVRLRTILAEFEERNQS